MSFPTKIQQIRRKNSEQWYINFPSAVAQMMDFSKGEVVHWSLHDRATLGCCQDAGVQTEQAARGDHEFHMDIIIGTGLGVHADHFASAVIALTRTNRRKRFSVGCGKGRNRFFGTSDTWTWNTTTCCGILVVRFSGSSNTWN